MRKSSKKVHICTNCKKLGHSIETCWAKGSGKEGKRPKQKKRSNFKTEKGKGKVNAAKDDSTDEKSDGYIAFINFNSTAFIKDSLGAAVLSILVLAHI